VRSAFDLVLGALAASRGQVVFAAGNRYDAAPESEGGAVGRRVYLRLDAGDPNRVGPRFARCDRFDMGDHAWYGRKASSQHSTRQLRP
jgi:hypothetical protein